MKRIAVGAILTGALVLSSVRTASAEHDCDTSRAGYCFVKGVRLPRTVPEFLKLRAKWSKDPFHAAALYVMALINFSMNETVGKQMMLLSRHESLLGKTGSKGGVYKGYDFRRSYYYHLNRMKRPKLKGCFPGYAANAKAKNGKWWVSPNKVEVAIKIQTRHVPDPSSGRYKLFIKTGNRASPFPLILQKNLRGIWKITNDSSALTGCFYPKRTTPSQAEKDL